MIFQYIYNLFYLLIKKINLLYILILIIIFFFILIFILKQLNLSFLNVFLYIIKIIQF